MFIIISIIFACVSFSNYYENKKSIERLAKDHEMVSNRLNEITTDKNAYYFNDLLIESGDKFGYNQYASKKSSTGEYASSNFKSSEIKLDIPNYKSHSIEISTIVKYDLASLRFRRSGYIRNYEDYGYGYSRVMFKADVILNVDNIIDSDESFFIDGYNKIKITRNSLSFCFANSYEMGDSRNEDIIYTDVFFQRLVEYINSLQNVISEEVTELNNFLISNKNFELDIPIIKDILVDIQDYCVGHSYSKSNNRFIGLFELPTPIDSKGFYLNSESSDIFNMISDIKKKMPLIDKDINIFVSMDGGNKLTISFENGETINIDKVKPGSDYDYYSSTL